MEEWKISVIDNDLPEKWLDDMKEANEILATHRYGIEPRLVGELVQSSRDHYASIDWEKLIAWAQFSENIADFKKAIFKNQMQITHGS